MLETVALICDGMLFMLTELTALPKEAIAEAAELAFEDVLDSVEFNDFNEESRALTFLATLGSNFKLTLAVIPDSCFLMSATILLTLFGPRKLSCAVKLKAVAIKL
jgi:hypothetical protein